MKKAYILLTLLLSVSCGDNAPFDIIPDEDLAVKILDVNFKKFCVDKYDTNRDGMLTTDEVEAVVEIHIDNIESITSIQGIEVFRNLKEFSACQCYNLMEANLYNNSKLYGVMFPNCKNLRSVVLPPNIAKLYKMAFYNCVGLTTVNLPNSLTEIGDEAFAFCSGISLLSIPGSVQTIGAYAFKSCLSLNYVTLSEGVQNIGEQAFYNCTSLEKITLPSTTLSIGDYFFVNCTGLKTVTCKAVSPPKAGIMPFMGCIDLRAIRVPAQSLGEYMLASGWRSEKSLLTGAML